MDTYARNTEDSMTDIARPPIPHDPPQNWYVEDCGVEKRETRRLAEAGKLTPVRWGRILHYGVVNGALPDGPA